MLGQAITRAIGHLLASVKLSNLTTLDLSVTGIRDFSPLANLTNLTKLILGGNDRISGLSLLVENSELGAGVTVSLGNNNLDLSAGSEDLKNIRQLRARRVVTDPTHRPRVVP